VRPAVARAVAALAALLAGCPPNARPPIEPPPEIVPEPPPPPPPVRALWITRFDYRSAEDVERVVRDAAGAGFDTLLFQVRGNATAFYRSGIEPWAAELGGQDPGFDPLELACAEAHRLGVALHAWVNVMPAWWGSTPPEHPGQLYNARPEWMWYDQWGVRQGLVERFYVSVNPCLPDVRAYLVALFRDLAARYPIDGLHLDYVRFPNEPPVVPAGSGIDYPRDAATLALFAAATGATPESDPEAWDRWRAAQVSLLVKEIRDMLRATRPEAVLSAAVGPVPERALEHFQDGLDWARAGLVDLVFPMNYTGTLAVFEQRLAPWIAPGVKSRVVVGLRLDSGERVEHVAQVERALESCDGFAVFAYSLLFESPDDVLVPGDDGFRQARAERREFWVGRLRELRGAAAR
jgi:uncharacterized lipoprotein YddW (UPF0748 family)